MKSVKSIKCIIVLIVVLIFNFNFNFTIISFAHESDMKFSDGKYMIIPINDDADLLYKGWGNKFGN